MLAQKWKSMSEEDRAEFKEIGTTEFQHKKEEWSKVLETRSTEHSTHQGTLAFLRRI